MEKKYYNNLGGWKQNVSRFTSVFVISFAVLISCQKKDSSNNNYIAPLPINQAGVVGACVGCNFAKVQLGQPQSTGAQSTPFTVQWILMGDQAMVQQMAYSATSAKNYSGQIEIQGTLTTSGFNLNGSNTYYSGAGQNGCVVPQGSYQISTSQVGQMSGGQVQVPQFEAISATNGARLIMQMKAIVMDPQATGTIAFLHGQMAIVSIIVNGQQMACGSSTMNFSYY